MFQHRWYNFIYKTNDVCFQGPHVMWAVCISMVLLNIPTGQKSGGENLGEHEGQSSLEIMQSLKKFCRCPTGTVSVRHAALPHWSHAKHVLPSNRVKMQISIKIFLKKQILIDIHIYGTVKKKTMAPFFCGKMWHITHNFFSECKGTSQRIQRFPSEPILHILNINITVWWNQAPSEKKKKQSSICLSCVK